MNAPTTIVNTFWWGVNSAFEVPIEALPVALVGRPSRMFAGFLIVVGGGLVAICVGSMFMLLGEGRLRPGVGLGLGVFLLISAPVLLVGLNLFVKRQVTTLDDTAVHWESRTLFRRSVREEPLQAFAGVLLKTAISRDEGTQIFDVLELSHASPANVVRLFKAPAGRPIAEAWAKYCRCFRLPAIEDVTPACRIVRDLVALETPLVDLIRSGRAVLPPPLASTPGSITLSAAGHEWTIRLTPDHTLRVGERGVTDISTERSRRVAAAARWHGVEDDSSGGLFYPREQILSFAVEEHAWEKKPGVVMIVRESPEPGGTSRTVRRRVYLYANDSLDVCTWLHAALLRGVALGADAAVSG